jgi:hypothetical protein
MKITSSNISMLSTHSYVERTSINEELKVWVGDKRPDFEKNVTDKWNPSANLLELTGLQTADAKGNSLYDKTGALKDSSRTSKSDKDMLELDSKNDLKARILERLIEALTGRKVKVQLIDQSDFKSDCPAENPEATKTDNAESNNQNQPAKAGWGLEYDYHETRYESEQTTFAAEGTVKTADGKEINFSVDVSMSREFMEENNISVRAGDAKKIDPLVIDFAGASTELTQTKFSFDLDIDGVSDSISFTNPSSGFLALDKNNDGVINDGSELFGPTTGQGFEELAAYDEDGNMWIDESDSVFKALLVWNKDAQGNDILSSLADKGVGAIYLGNVDTQYSIKDQANQLQGQVARAGVYLKETGETGTVRQIDLAA